MIDDDLDLDSEDTDLDLPVYFDEYGQTTYVLTCPKCGGSGRDKMSDGIEPCEHCTGEGYLWWL